jgi:hypothetical protein
MALAITAYGCIAFVSDDPSALSTTCHFQGDDSACGRCVASACASSLGACCGDATCTQTTLPLLQSCFGTGSLCSSFLVDAPALATCIATSCATCAGDGGANGTFDGAVGPSPDAGQTYCSKSGDSCFCSVGSPNGAACNAAGIKGGGLCCASYGWPTATNASCTCEPFSCTPSSLGGSCDLSTNSTGTTSWPGPGCCSYGTFCDCEPSITCTATPVDTCDLSTVGCDSSQVQVASCSF